jgi:poly(3-hydroxyalkanoate) synthetase
MTAWEAPGPLRRLGPRPLWLHLMLATTPSADWQSVWRSWSAGSPAAIPAPDAALLAGIAAYRRHPFQRSLTPPPSIWAEGSARLLDYGPPEGRPLLVVPSLVNRAYVLDLLPAHSMLRFLAANGVRPLLLDWGFPDEAERAFSLTDLVAGRLLRALESVGRPVALAGYCMGGLMAVAAAQLRPALVERLVLLATPWDFWAGDESGARRLAGLLPMLEPGMGLSGALATDALQVLFSLLDPSSVGRKYRDFATQDPASERAALFVALEDWLNDGVPLAAPVAREVIGHWYGANAPARGAWHMLGVPVRPDSLRVPSLVVIPGRDRIVPPASAAALAACIAGAEVLTPGAGHVGMVAGSGARQMLWEELVRWLTA